MTSEMEIYLAVSKVIMSFNNWAAIKYFTAYRISMKFEKNFPKRKFQIF